LTLPPRGANTAGMRIVDGETIISALARLIGELVTAPPSLRDAVFSTPDLSGAEREAAAILDENLRIARAEGRPLCQDCGMVQVWVKKGKFASFSGASTLRPLIDEAVRRAYRDGGLRCSMVKDPFDRKNSGDNTPASVHIEEIDGADLEFTVLLKGGGSENVSRIAMLPPSAGRAGVADIVLTVLRDAGGSGCPPYQVAVGIGGSFDTVATLAKRALLFDDDDDPELRDLILRRVPELGYGIAGFPGVRPVTAVRVATAPTHIAMLPVAVLLNCHAFRRGGVSL